MAKLLKLRRGTTSQHSSFTGAEGEVTVDTTKDTIVVHDGSTAGGTPLAKESDNLSLIDEDNMSSDSATRPPSQQSVKAYVDALPDVIDEDNMSSDSATRPPSQQSVKAYVDTADLTKMAKAGGVFTGDVTFDTGQTNRLIMFDYSDQALEFWDDTKATFGTDTDLSIYSDGSSGVVSIPDAGNLYIKQGSSNLATFSGATNQIDFHEDVVFIGASSNGTWDKSANKFIANVQGDLTGTADVATEATNVTVVANNSTDETVYPAFVDGATGTQGIETDTGLTYNPSTGLLTTAAVTTTGNVTVGGNLQVDGTTTTVNSSTMTVTDKNIEIAKGAANDAAADGAGITVDSGDGDKTWNWVDATDAWTSSEHIHLGDNKKLLIGDGSDLAIYHTGSHSKIEDTGTGKLWLLGSAILFSNAAGDESLAEFTENGSCTLRHDNNIRVTTTAAGVTVNGTVTDSKGNLRSVPVNSQGSTYTLVAADAGKAVALNFTNGGCTINTNLFVAGDVVTIINASTTDKTITRGSGLNLYNSADGTDANRTLAARGMATLIFVSHDGAYISGAGLS